MSEGVKISVIIPVYNIEGYIEKCIRSAAEQDFCDLEILAVDDGSTDESGKICDELKSAYNCLRVLHKENGGLSDARNFGLRSARGKYVFFLDGDDFLLPGALKSLFFDAEGQNADVVIGKAELLRPVSAMERYEKIAEESFLMHRPYTGKEYLLGCLKGGALRVEAWRCLYRREFLLENGLEFKFGIYHEDEEFTPRVMLKAKTVVLTDETVYFYNNGREGSVTNTVNPKKAADKIEIYTELSKFFKGVRPRTLRRRLEDDLAWKYADCAKRGAVGAKRLFPLKYAYRPKRRIKALAFAISPRLYAKYF